MRQLELCPSRIQQLASTPGTVLTQFGDNCYELVHDAVVWSQAEYLCKQHGGHLAYIANQDEQDFIYYVLVKDSYTVWIGLNDRTHEEHFQWTSGNPVNYTNWKPGRKDHLFHHGEDCVLMMVNGQWDDVQCGDHFQHGYQHAYVCQFAISTNVPLPATITPRPWFPVTQTPVPWIPDISPTTTPRPWFAVPTTHVPLPATTTHIPFPGDVSKCSAFLRTQAVRDHGILAQHGHYCYEFISQRSTWSNAESICQQRRGHLATITNAIEQMFIMYFMSRYSASQDVWIGLNDGISEGTFQWTSGEVVQYQNWVPNHTKSIQNQNYEDCVLFKPQQRGKWDAVTCGSSNVFGSSGELHPYLCRFGATGADSLDGDISKCSTFLQNQETIDGGILAQYGDYCYEFINQRSTWSNAERICQQRRGHLVTINNAHEQAFIMDFMNRHSANYDVWIGLHDLNMESRFQWASGKAVQYLNWLPNHLDNTQSHNYEDCVLFKPQQRGKWDDVNCGSSNFFGSSGELHPYICSYEHNGASGSVLVG